MSIICTAVEDSPHLRKNLRRGLNGYVWATVDPAKRHQLSFPSDYKYFSCLLQRKYALWADRIQNFKLRPDDIWVLGFLKTGTTWMRNIVYQLKIKHLDFTAGYIQVDSALLEAPITFEKIDGDEEYTKFVEQRHKSIDELDAMLSPRMIKSHLPAYLLPKELWAIQPKIIYMSRDAKDAAVSLYHMMEKQFSPYKGTKNAFFDEFMNGFVLFGPFYEHISSFHQLRDFKNILFLTYEELKTNTFECLKRISIFLDCSYSDEQLRQLMEHVSFEKMRAKIELPTTNSDKEFCRKGEISGHRDDLSDEYIKKFDEWTAQKKKELNLP